MEDDNGDERPVKKTTISPYMDTFVVEEEEEEPTHPLPRYSDTFFVPRLSSAAPLTPLHFSYPLSNAREPSEEEDVERFHDGNNATYDDVDVTEETIYPHDDWAHSPQGKRRTSRRGTPITPTMNLFRLAALTVGFLGIQFSWTIEMAYGSPFLLELGLSRSLMSLVWIAGPISGLIAQPFFGSLSDRCTLKLGRRRPFILGGSLATILSMLTIGHSQDLLSMGSATTASSYRTFAIIVAVFGFWIMDFAINVIMASCRALVVDVVPPEQQQTANAFASFLLGCGNILGYFTCNLSMTSLLPFLGTQMKGLCYVGSLVLLLSIACTSCTVTEVPLTEKPSSGT
jgi:hypothetical protein